MNTAAAALAAKPARTVSRYRWSICALLFLATTINYMDRQILGLLAPMLQKDIGWTQMEYSWIVNAFQFSYAVGLLGFGWVIDKLGTKLSYSIAMLFWSGAAMLHAAVGSVAGFAGARALLGLGEAGNFPSAIKATAEWFPKEERALATGLFNSGANIGAVFAPALIPWIALNYGWRGAFIIIGALGLVWLLPWAKFFGKPEAMAAVDAEELAHIRQDNTAEENSVVPPTVKWTSLLGHRQTWAFAIGKFCTDPIWWFFLFWLPKWLNETRQIDLAHMGAPLVAVYLFATVGSVGGGWISGALMKTGMTSSRARKMAMFLCACCVVPIAFATVVQSLWVAVILVGLAAAAHQGWSANIFTTASDMFPKHAVGSVVGIGGMAGSLGGVLFSTVIGVVLERTGNYWALFTISACAYLVAFVIFHLLAPGMKKVEL
ncbi:MFS transporter [Uliginosibacterium sp. 31-16]|uniref:MFS transporter n=1 Tax=Uliginosibacterium sp. 31-16 TaxID=3068315 RepID=UPI00273F77EF|nr:MFS transporter [Uliginosibacterium sp. 31-16]MDP5238794.1 MFS transporter [Uliginosibacterium sp. 31-16]